MRFHYSLAGLLIAVGLTAVACASLVFAGTAWLTSVASATVFFLATALLISLLRPSHARGFWVGVAVWGWVYLMLVFGPWADRIAPKLATSVALQFAVAHMPQAEPPSDENSWNQPALGASVPAGTFAYYGVTGTTTTPNYNASFLAIGHFWCAILAGFVGGWLARRVNALGAKSRGDPSEAA
jgi:hypothetical protein